MKIHLPQIACVMLRPPIDALTSNKISFSFPRFVNKIDIKNYLEAIYGVKVLKVNTVVPTRRHQGHPQPWKFRQSPMVSVRMWNTMRKIAHVTIDTPFTYPSLSVMVQQSRESEASAKQANINKSIEQIRLFRDNWDKVVEERYMEDSNLKDYAETISPPCDPLSEPLGNLKLDAAALVKGNAKNRVHLNSRGKARKPGKVHD